MSTAITPEALYRDYHEKVERYISSHVSDMRDRADLKQQVFVNAIAALDGYDPSRAAPGTWLYAITRNAVTDYYRRRGRSPEPTELEELDRMEPQNGVSSLSGDVDSRLLRQELLEALAEALEQLPERERNIVIFRFYDGLSAQETAMRVGVSYANVRVLQHNAMRKLRRCLAEAGIF